MDPKASKLNKVDARVKLIWIVVTIIAGIFYTSIPTLLTILASILLVAWIGGVLGKVLRSLRGLSITIIIIGLIFGLTVSGRPLFYLLPPSGAFGGIAFSQEGLLLGVVSTIRIFIFAIPLAVFVMTTHNSDMLQALLFFRMPLDYALMMILALNFVPVYVLEFSRISDAQKARAHSLMDKGLISKARGLVPVFIPLSLNAVERANTLGKVLEMRGVTRRQIKPEFAAFHPGSWLLLAVSLLLLIAAIFSLVTKVDLFSLL